MADPHPFRSAVEAKDFEAVAATLREDVELHSPILFRGFEGRDAVLAVLTHVEATLEDFSYTD
jgi:ketosteroid isomerase-like protein